MKVMAQTLYYDHEYKQVYLTKKDNFYWESFHPSLVWNEGEEGYLVVCETQLYNSYGAEGCGIEIIDAYKDEDLAHAAAQSIVKETNSRILRVPLGNGKTYLVSDNGDKKKKNPDEKIYTFPWQHWGCSLEGVRVVHFVLNDKKSSYKDYYPA